MPVCLPCFCLCLCLFSLCSAPLNPALMHLITSRQSGSSWLIHSRSMPERTALYVTLLSLLQSFVGSFQSWALRLMNMYPGLFSQQFWGSLTKRDERALCGCLLDLTVTFLWSLLPLFIFNRLYPQVRLAAPFERWHCQSSHPKSSLQLSYFVIRELTVCLNRWALIESLKHSRNILPNTNKCILNEAQTKGYTTLTYGT